MSDDKSMSFDDGDWYAASVGEFIGMLIDAGPSDRAVAFRVIEDGPQKGHGESYARRIEMVIIPDGQVRIVCEAVGVKGYNRIIRKQINAGLVT